MNATKILNQAQSEAVYSAMCALNNVGGRIDTVLNTGERIVETDVGVVEVYAWWVDSTPDRVEQHINKSAFATAYGLNSDEWQSDVAAAAGGLTQTAIER